MPDILLIQPPIRDFYLTAKRTIPYGLACIASALKERGFSVRILDALATGRSRTISMPGQMDFLKEYYTGADFSPFSLFRDFRHYGLDFEKIGEIAGNLNPFLVGISSLFTAYSEEAIRTAEEVRRRLPGAVIVAGGHHPTEMPGEVLQNRCIDFVLRGEGEIGMPLLARAILEKTPLEDVPGIGFRKDGAFFLNPPARMERLDDAPPPEIELIDGNFYQRKKKPCAVVVASRGCPLKCSYCSIGGATWSRFRLKSVGKVLKELERAVFDFGARFIDFEDENISFNRGWFLELLNAITERFPEIDIEFRAMNGLFPPTIDREVAASMKKAGFTALNLSLCTTCREQLKAFLRPDVREAFENALELAAEFGLESVGYIIAGAPGQKPEDSIADLLYLARQKVLAGVSVFYPAPGSADFEKCRARNLLPLQCSLMRATVLPISDSTTREESATLMRLGRLLNFLKSLSTDEITDVFTSAAKPGSDTAGRCIELSRRIQELAASEKTGSARQGRFGYSMRREMGKLLLASFLSDGVLLGIGPEMKMFEHRASRPLSLMFRDGLLHQFSPR